MRLGIVMMTCVMSHGSAHHEIMTIHHDANANNMRLMTSWFFKLTSDNVRRRRVYVCRKRHGEWMGRHDNSIGISWRLHFAGVMVMVSLMATQP